MSYKKSHVPSNIPQSNITTDTKKLNGIASSISKWVPLICAGAAVGVSIIAIKEIKNVRKELITLKAEGFSNTESKDVGLFKKIETMDEQIRKISKYLSSMESKQKENIVIKKVINSEPEPKVVVVPQVFPEVISNGNNKW